MTTTPLPPLPEVGYLGDDASYGYDANDMTEYAFAARADLEAEVARLREALITAKWMLERDQIDEQKMAVIDKCNDALEKTA